MTQSATRTVRDRRTDRALAITDCAQRLTDEHGLDGFTMDDLAEAADVSRRTLFNYFPGKLDAVLGDWPVLDDDAVAVFLAGGPHHDLVADLRELVAPMMASETMERSTLVRQRRIMLANPRLMAAVHARYEELSGEVVAHVATREGDSFGELRARIAVKVLGAIFDAAVDEFMRDEQERPLRTHFDEAVAAARTLMGA